MCLFVYQSRFSLAKVSLEPGDAPDPREELLRDGGGSEIILLQINKWIFILEDGTVPFGGCEGRNFRYGAFTE